VHSLRTLQCLRVESIPHPARLGRYEIASRLAQGGMAELFLAQLPGIEGFAKRVVVKRVLPELARDRQFVQMFLEEARLAATLHHQNVVQVLDIGHDDAGYFFAMEYLHGADVGDVMRTLAGRDLPLAIALEIIRGACAGLHHAHERKVVHRDVSPQNLFVTFDGGVKLLDFGIAKAVQQIASHYTRTGTLRGKLPYMSPEQCQAESIDRRSDIFSLAVVLWEITVGERLFGAGNQSDFEILKAIVERDAPAPSSRKSGYPPALEAIVLKGLRRDRAARYQTCDELLGELETFMRASSTWASARDVAAFMKSLYPERARAAQEQAAAAPPAAAGDVVPFPRPTRVVAGEADTVDLPPRAPTSPPLAPPARRRLWPFALIGVVLVAAAFAVGLTIGGSSAPTASEPRPPGPAAKPAEDAHWFQPDDYLTSEKPLENRRLDRLLVAKQTRPPDQHHEASFLTADGQLRTTTQFWATHIARPEELVLGRLAFCPGDYNVRDAKPPPTKRDAKLGWWFAGRITDISELARGSVRVADGNCELAAVRVSDAAEPLP